jgi:hypothetical protein
MNLPTAEPPTTLVRLAMCRTLLRYVYSDVVPNVSRCGMPGSMGWPGNETKPKDEVLLIQELRVMLRHIEEGLK